jgi:Uma2 family endonuclease
MARSGKLGRVIIVGMATLPTQPLSEEEYLRIERQALEKSEFHDGQMFAMAGGSGNHASLAGRVISLLDQQLPTGCSVFTSDLRINILKSGTFTYPDCSVVCGEPQYSSEQWDNLLNPLLIVEVLSPSTESYDRGKKFELYRTIASFREYLIIHQNRRLVEHYSRQDDHSWVLREYSGAEATVSIISLGVNISLGYLYAKARGLDD